MHRRNKRICIVHTTDTVNSHQYYHLLAVHKITILNSCFMGILYNYNTNSPYTYAYYLPYYAHNSSEYLHLCFFRQN